MSIDEQRKKARVIAFNPDGDYYYQKGMTAYHRGDLHRASKYVNRAIAFEPNEPEYLCQQAAILAELENHQESIRLLKKVVDDIDDSITECFFFIANNHAYLGNYDEAIHEVQRYMALEPNGTFINEARELYKLLVLESGQEQVEEEPHVTEHEKGRQALENGHYEKAIYFFDKIINDKPEFWAAYNNLAVAYYSQGQVDKALDTLYRVLAADSGNVHALCNLATFYFQLDRREAMVEAAEVLKKLYPMFPEHQSKLGSTFFLMGEYDAAYYWLKKAQKNDRYLETAFYYWLALTAYKVGRESEAMVAWRKVNFFKDSPFHAFEYGKIREMFRADDAAINPIVRSLLEQQLLEGDYESQTFSMFMLYDFGDNQARALLSYEAGRHDLDDRYTKTIAQELLNRLSGNHFETTAIDVMLTIQQHMDGGKPDLRYYKMYGFWKQMMQDGAMHADDDVLAFAAAIDYVWKKQNKNTVTQKQIADRYQVTRYRLKKYINKVSEASIHTVES